MPRILDDGQAPARLYARGMLRAGTPVEYRPRYGLYVKREDLACPSPGPPFSKARGVYRWCAKQSEKLIGVLDTRHSQGGWAVARACAVLGKRCVVYYPEFKYEPGPREPQRRAAALGAELVGLPAGRSAILYHAARKDCESRGGAIIPNALKLAETVEETAREVVNVGRPDVVVISVSSGTIAAGVIRGLGDGPRYVLHMGYSRSVDDLEKYVTAAAGRSAELEIIDEGYAYADTAADGPTPPWPCNTYYDLKAFRWWVARGRAAYGGGHILFWNVG